MPAPNGTAPQWRDFLSRLIGELDARGGAVWLLDKNQLHPGATIGISPSEFFISEADQQVRLRCLSDVLQQGKPQSADVIPVNGQPPGGPAVILSAPVLQAGRVIGVVEIVQRAKLAQQIRQGQLQYLLQACQIPEPVSTSPAVSSSRQNSSPASPIAEPGEDEVEETQPSVAADWPRVLLWLKHLQSRWRLKEVAGTIANEGRVLWHADRVSVVVPRGRRVQVLAVSGQDKVHHRANVIQSLKRLAQLVMETREPFQYGSDSTDIPPQLDIPLSLFAQQSGARYLLIAPLLEPAPAEPLEADAPLAGKPREVVGALVIEQMQLGKPEPALVAHLDLVRDHLAAALHQAVWRESIFLLPLWLGLGRIRHWFRGRRLALGLGILAALIGAAATMIWLPWDFRIDGKGRLMPITQRDIFAPWDGHVVELYVAGGERVAARQPLLLLRNDDLQTEYVKTRSEIDEKRKLIAAYQAQLDDAERNADRDEATRLQGKVAETRIEVEGLSERIAIFKDRIDRLLVVSPIHGVVTTFQAEQLLINRPVQRGEVLLEVMDDNDRWRLELEVPEHRLGHILAAQAIEGDALPITFRMLTKPEQSYAAQLADVGTRAVISEEQGSIVELTADLESDSLEKPSIGAQVRARIGCGKKPLGYCLFGDVIEFVQKYLWW